MEQKRRTIKAHSSQKKRESTKKVWTIIGVILGLALVFFVSYKIAFGLITAGEHPEIPETNVSSSTEEDIANMSREDLEDSYIKLKKQLEEKDEEIEMLKKRLEDNEDAANDDAEETPEPTEKPSEEKTESTSKPTAPPAATAAPSEGLMSPEQLESAANSAE